MEDDFQADIEEIQKNRQRNTQKTDAPQAEKRTDVTFFGMTNYRHKKRKFGIKLDDRRRHMYVIGKTGTGKSSFLENLITSDIEAGHGLCVVDPHGETIEHIIDNIPSERINDTLYFNPADLDYPIGFNILEDVSGEEKHILASGLMGVFTKIWAGVWSARMEYILNNTILALLDTPGTTLLGIPRMLADDKYRKKIVDNIQDPIVKAFWVDEFANYNDRFRQEAIAPIQNKVGQFLTNRMIRNIVSQSKSRFSMRQIMDEKKILLLDLSKGKIGEDNSKLLGSMLITKIQLAAMSRIDVPEEERQDFFLYVDEFQNFATSSFASILSEARKYRLGLTVAHQYIEQLEDDVKAAILGNVGTLISFRVGATDAEELVKEFTPTFAEPDLVAIPNYTIYLKLMIDGVSSQPFSALTLPPVRRGYGNKEKIQKVTRERYGMPKEEIEDKIRRWAESGATIARNNQDPKKQQPKGASAPFKPKPKGNPSAKSNSSSPPKIVNKPKIVAGASGSANPVSPQAGTVDPEKLFMKPKASPKPSDPNIDTTVKKEPVIDFAVKKESKPTIPTASKKNSLKLPPKVKAGSNPKSNSKSKSRPTSKRGLNQSSGSHQISKPGQKSQRQNSHSKPASPHSSKGQPPNKLESGSTQKKKSNQSHPKNPWRELDAATLQSILESSDNDEGENVGKKTLEVSPGAVVQLSEE